MPSIKDEIRLRASNRRHFSVDILEAITDGEETEGMEGAPQLTLNLVDPTGALMASDKLLRDAARETGDPAAKTLRPIDVDIEGRWYRLLGAQAQDGTVTLTFEAREVAYLRQHDKHLVASRSDITRALFIRRMVNEVGGKPRKVKRADGRGTRKVRTDPIPFWSPEIRKKRPVAKPTADERKQLADDAEQTNPENEKRSDVAGIRGVKIKGRRADAGQRRRILTCAKVAEDLNAGPKATKAMHCAAIGESGYGSNVGSRGTTFQTLVIPESQLATQAKHFLQGGRSFRPGGAIGYAKDHPEASVGEIASKVEVSDQGASYYDQFGAEAQAIMDATGSSSGSGASSSDGNGSYYKQFTLERKEGENSWAAMGRLAGDVTRRIFLQYDPDQRVRTLIYASDEELFEQRVRLKLELDGPSLASEPSYQLDYRKTAREVELEILGEWRVPVGQPIQLLPGRDGSPIAGRWLVWEVRRPWGSETVTVSLRQPQKDKPEPRPEAAQRSDNSAGDAETSLADQSGLGGLDADTHIVRFYRSLGAIEAKHYPYVWGGGHSRAGTPDRGTGRDPGTGYDCSGAVAAALVAAGLYTRGRSVPRSDFLPPQAGAQRGKGKYLTVWANAGHIFVETNLPGKGRRMWGTSRENPNGGAGFHSIRNTSPFTAWHFPGL